MYEDIKNIKVLVTGATGYIGSELVIKLANLGCKVAIIKRTGSDTTSLNSALDKIIIYECDKSTRSILQIVGDAKPDIVVHLASLFLAEHQSDDIEDLITSNLLFSTQLVEAMKENNIKFLINTGTSWEHFNNSIYDPVCLYAATKHAFHSILEYYLQTSDLRVVTLKLFDTYGPRDNRLKLVTLLQKFALSGELLPMSEGKQLIDIVYIDDVIDAFLISMSLVQLSEAKSNQSFTVSSLNPISLQDLVQKFQEASGATLNIDWGSRKYRDREVMMPWNNGCNVPGWSPKVGLFEGFSNLSLIQK